MKRAIYIFSLILLFGCERVAEKQVAKDASFTSLNSKKAYKAGETISLKFKYTESNEVLLVFKNAIGTTVLKPVIKDMMLEFEVPNSFNRYAGICHWKLIYNQKTKVTGSIHILPNTHKTHIESYLGPRSISAGEVDYSMMVVAPTDLYDNPLSTGTQVQIKYQFQNTVDAQTLEVKNLVVWKNIYAPTKSGRILVTASCDTTISKELTSIVFPDKPVDFSIDYQRNHKYADGNQIITFATSIIYDVYGNIISDGTLVSFFVEDTSGMLLKSMGTTINGIAKARLLHPTEKETWKATAYITGVAKSNTIAVDFEPSLLDFDIAKSLDKRTLSIGPLKSFMNQIVPDGMPIRLLISDSKNNSLQTKETTARLGMGSFTLSSDFFPKGTYKISVEVGGIQKTEILVLE